MKTINLPTMRIRIESEKVLIAPLARPDDWREVTASLLDKWLVKQWREQALQPVVNVQPKEKV